jgi:acyl-CoA synthetase (AMP-forming)/AMP-acid ligase II
MRAYRDGSSPLDSDGWLRTGDRGSISSDGFLTVEGREGDLIITGGENVWPEQVEAVLKSHPNVVDVCVAGVSDDVWGYAVHAWIVATPGEQITLDQIRGHVKDTLAPHCAPQQIHLVEHIPRTSLGKPQRHSLVDSLNA